METIEFSPENAIVKLCLQGMRLEAEGKTKEAGSVFQQAWNEATNDFEKYLAAYYLARNEGSTTDKLRWYETSLEYALQIDDIAVTSALPTLYSHIADCHEDLRNPDKATEFRELARSSSVNIADEGPFYHGSRIDLQVGDHLTPGNRSNYQSDLIMNHTYFTTQINGAGLAAALANGEGPERVYVVEPTGEFENDPNLTDKKFPGNPTRSYRTAHPLKIIGEATEWVRQTPEQIRQWKEKLSGNKGKIIN